VAGTVPNDFTPSDDLTTGADAGDVDICDEASFIEPKVTAEPRKGGNNVEKYRMGTKNNKRLTWFYGAHVTPWHTDTIFNRHSLTKSARTTRVSLMNWSSGRKCWGL
jgi:hypothetical protein